MKRRILFDPVLKRPGCVLLQAVAGCDPSVAHGFDSKKWLLGPTPDMAVFEVTDEQLAVLVEKFG